MIACAGSEEWSEGGFGTFIERGRNESRAIKGLE